MSTGTGAVTVIIPARYQSSRFPGKPLEMIDGRPLFWYPYDQARRSARVGTVVVATDDQRIADACRFHDVPAVLTGEHRTGTDRLAEAASTLAGDLFVNLQADEPLVPTATITALIDQLLLWTITGEADVVNGCTPITSDDELFSSNCVKVAVGPTSNILYYSRAPIPSGFRGHCPRYRQLGLYGFTRQAVERFSSYPRGPLEQSEDVEMLRFLEHGDPIRLIDLPPPGPAVDTPQDLATVRTLLGHSTP
jgi:3-deoxy-manno-octulosonate cytidylyltransferase (CMP-KDO synthetase)